MSEELAPEGALKRPRAPGRGPPRGRAIRGAEPWRRRSRPRPAWPPGWGTGPQPRSGGQATATGTRSFETLLRYRGAAMAAFWRALRTLKALQAEQAAGQASATAPARAARPPQANPKAPAPRPPLAQRPRPNEPERGPRSPGGEYVFIEPSGRGRTLHEPGAGWQPNEPEPGPKPRWRVHRRRRRRASSPGQVTDARSWIS